MIEKALKHAKFCYDEENKIFYINTAIGAVALNKAYSFALQRFFLRISQRNFLRRKHANKTSR